MSDFYLDKLVYITGGSSGIGLALACEAVAQGASVLLIARNVDKLQQAVELVESHKTQSEQRVNYLSLDLTDADATAADIAPAISAYGTPNVLITCAGVAVAKSFEEHSVADFRYNLEANVIGSVTVTHALIPHMLNAGGGHIALLGSLGGLMPVWGYSAYSTSKAALVGLADVLRYEYEPQGIKVSLICPPEVDTPMIAAEAATVPRQTRFIKDLVGTSDPKTIARHSLKNIAKSKALVISGFRAKLFYHTQRLMPGAYRMTVKLLLRMS